MDLVYLFLWLACVVTPVTAPPPIKPSVPSSECRSMMDLVLVVDGSDSISATDYDKQRAALASLVKSLDIGPRMARIGVVVYSTGISQVIPISDNKKMLVQEMYKLSHPRDGTNTALGIESMIDLYAKDARQNVPWVCIVITDGLSKDPDKTAAQAARAREMGINMFAVGISHDIRKSELEAIAARPEQVLMLTSFDQLSVSLTSLMKVVCPCPPPPPVNNANVEDGSRAIGSSLLYTCSPGYQQMGDQPIITCGADSTWTALDFECLACPEPLPDYANGIVVAGSNLLNTTRQYLCKMGYTAPSPVEITCLPGPTGPGWTDPQMKCSACGLPPPAAYAIVDGGMPGANLIGTTKPYICKPGYIPSGPMETTCIDDKGFAVWTPVQNACIACDQPPIVPNADVDIKGNNLVGSVRTYSCLPGFSPTGPIEAVCIGKNGKPGWEVTKHQCITCSQPPVLPNAIVDKTGNLLVGAVRKYMCEDGFQSTGPIEVMCVASNGVTFWDGPNHSCITCPVPPIVPNAVLHPSGNTLIGAVRTYDCKKGFIPTGPIKVGCVGGPNGPHWTPVDNECITCEAPPLLPNAVLTVIGDNMVGSVRTYLCMEGFSGSKPGPITIECKAEYVDNLGRAYWDKPSHGCIACPIPPPLPYARVMPGENVIGSMRVYECEPGFFATGPIVTQCLDTIEWSVPEHSCSACGPTPIVPHGQVLEGPHLVGTIRTILCDQGYVPTGPPVIRCQENATWSPIEFQCKRCKDPYPVKFAVLEPGERFVGTVRHYTCLPGYLATGPITSTCAVPGEFMMPDWSTPVHYCKDCGEPYPVKFGHAMPGPKTMGAVQHYKCDDGFVPSNQPMSHCMPNGEWSPPNFKCIKTPKMKSFDTGLNFHRQHHSPRLDHRKRILDKPKLPIQSKHPSLYQGRVPAYKTKRIVPALPPGMMHKYEYPQAPFFHQPVQSPPHKRFAFSSPKKPNPPLPSKYFFNYPHPPKFGFAMIPPPPVTDMRPPLDFFNLSEFQMYFKDSSNFQFRKNYGQKQQIPWLGEIYRANSLFYGPPTNYNFYPPSLDKVGPALPRPTPAPYCLCYRYFQDLVLSGRI